jgi:hypothetical protein
MATESAKRYLLAAILFAFAYLSQHTLESIFIVDFRFVFPFASDLTAYRAFLWLVYFPMAAAWVCAVGDTAPRAAAPAAKSNLAENLYLLVAVRHGRSDHPAGPVSSRSICSAFCHRLHSLCGSGGHVHRVFA